MRTLAMLIALAAAAATPALAQSTTTDTTTTTTTPTTTTTTPPASSTTTVTSPDGTATTVQAPAGSSVTTTGSTQTTVAPAATTQPVVGSGGDDVTEHREVVEEHHGIRTSGVELDLLGGALGYRTSPRSSQNAGPSYGFALGFRGGGPIGVELSYQGATYTPAGTADLTGGATRITENGGQAILKLGGQAGPFDLYVLGGGAISRFSVTGGSVGSGVAGGTSIHDGTIYKVPAGVGLDFHIPVGGPDLLIGARGQYNFLFNQSEVFSGVSNSSRDADQIQAQVNVGMLF